MAAMTRTREARRGGWLQRCWRASALVLSACALGLLVAAGGVRAVRDRRAGDGGGGARTRLPALHRLHAPARGAQRRARVLRAAHFAERAMSSRRAPTRLAELAGERPELAEAIRGVRAERAGRARLDALAERLAPQLTGTAAPAGAGAGSSLATWGKGLLGLGLLLALGSGAYFATRERRSDASALQQPRVIEAAKTAVSASPAATPQQAQTPESESESESEQAQTAVPAAGKRSKRAARVRARSAQREPATARTPADELASLERVRAALDVDPAAARAPLRSCSATRSRRTLGACAGCSSSCPQRSPRREEEEDRQRARAAGTLTWARFARVRPRSNAACTAPAAAMRPRVRRSASVRAASRVSRCFRMRRTGFAAGTASATIRDRDAQAAASSKLVRDGLSLAPTFAHRRAIFLKNGAR
jgi:hypothetical protein